MDIHEEQGSTDGTAGALVSVVIINHNYGQFLGTCLDSVLAQTHAALEVVVVDDGSTDGSADVLKSYGERITIVQQANLGHVRAFNAGYAASRGDVVLFVDADDILYPDCIARSAGELARWAVQAAVPARHHRCERL